MANIFNYDGSGSTGALSGHTSDGSTSLYNFTLTVLYGNFVGATQNDSAFTSFRSSIAPASLPSMKHYVRAEAKLFSSGKPDSVLRLIAADDYRDLSGALKGAILTFETRRLPIGLTVNAVWSVAAMQVPYGPDMVTVPALSGTGSGGTISVMSFAGFLIGGDEGTVVMG